jgi:hypothetical protein
MQIAALLLLVTLAWTAPVQAGTCTSATVADFTAAVAHEPEWPVMLEYATHKRFLTTPTEPATRCTRDDGTVYWIVSLANRFPSKPSAAVWYDPASPPGIRVKVAWQKGKRVAYLAAPLVTRRMTMNADGTLKQMRLLDLRGHRLDRLAARRLLQCPNGDACSNAVPSMAR